MKWRAHKSAIICITCDKVLDHTSDIAIYSKKLNHANIFSVVNCLIADKPECNINFWSDCVYKYWTTYHCQMSEMSKSCSCWSPEVVACGWVLAIIADVLPFSLFCLLF